MNSNDSSNPTGENLPSDGHESPPTPKQPPENSELWTSFEYFVDCRGAKIAGLMKLTTPRGYDDAFNALVDEIDFIFSVHEHPFDHQNFSIAMRRLS